MRVASYSKYAIDFLLVFPKAEAVCCCLSNWLGELNKCVDAHIDYILFASFRMCRHRNLFLAATHHTSKKVDKPSSLRVCCYVKVAPFLLCMVLLCSIHKYM